MKIINKKFNRDYQEIESYEAGVVLTGDEVKSIRLGRIRLEDSYVKFINNDLYLINCHIASYPFSNDKNYQPTRSRRLLLHKKEIVKILTKMKSSRLTIAPKSCYNKGKLIKLEIALARGRKDIEKRKLEKQKDIMINEKKEIKEYIKKWG